MVPLIKDHLLRRTCLFIDILAQLLDKLLGKVLKEFALVNNGLVDVDFDFGLEAGCDLVEETTVCLLLRCVMVVVKVFLDVLLDVQWRVLLFHEFGHLGHLFFEFFIFGIEILNEAVHTTDDHTKEPTSNNHKQHPVEPLRHRMTRYIPIPNRRNRRKRPVNSREIPIPKRLKEKLLITTLIQPTIIIRHSGPIPNQVEETGPKVRNHYCH